MKDEGRADEWDVCLVLPPRRDRPTYEYERVWVKYLIGPDRVKHDLPGGRPCAPFAWRTNHLVDGLKVDSGFI